MVSRKHLRSCLPLSAQTHEASQLIKQNETWEELTQVVSLKFLVIVRNPITIELSLPCFRKRTGDKGKR